MINDKIHKITLKFHQDNELENKFQNYYRESSRSMVLMGVLTGVSIIASFYTVDYLLFTPIYKELFFLRTVNVALASILALYAFVLNKKSNHLFWVSFIGPLMTGIVQTHIMGIAEENVHIMYFPGMILVLMYNFCFLKQRFVHATISSFIMYIYFNVLMANSLGINSEFLLMNMFFGSSIFIGLWVSYILEYSTRNQFLLTQKIESDLEDRKEIYKVVVHDLKNPVSIIKSQVNLLKATNKIEEKYSKRIFNSTDRMLYLLDHLLKFCEIEEKEVRLEFKEYNIQEVMEICLENNSFAAEAKEIELNHIKDKNGGHITKIDAFKTQEVMDNIISNAIKYAPLGSRVDISYGEDSDSYLIKVKDFGQGIKEEEISKVFDKFTKLSSVPTAGENSNGLGLSLSKNLMEIQGGTITCQSKFGAWTLFTIYIPKRELVKKAA